MAALKSPPFHPRPRPAMESEEGRVFFDRPPSMLAPFGAAHVRTATTRTRFISCLYGRRPVPSRSWKGWDGLPESQESRARVKTQMTLMVRGDRSAARGKGPFTAAQKALPRDYSAADSSSLLHTASTRTPPRSNSCSMSL